MRLPLARRHHAEEALAVDDLAAETWASRRRAGSAPGECRRRREHAPGDADSFTLRDLQHLVAITGDALALDDDRAVSEAADERSGAVFAGGDEQRRRGAARRRGAPGRGARRRARRPAARRRTRTRRRRSRDADRDERDACEARRGQRRRRRAARHGRSRPASAGRSRCRTGRRRWRIGGGGHHGHRPVQRAGSTNVPGGIGRGSTSTSPPTTRTR